MIKIAKAFAVSQMCMVVGTICVGAESANESLSGPMTDEGLILVVRRAAEMRQSALLADGVRAKFELRQTNPGEVATQLPDGPVVRGRPGITAGDSRSQVDFVAVGGKWRFNLSLRESQEMPVAAAASTTIELASDGSIYSALDRLTGQGLVNHTRVSAPAGELRQNMELPTEYWLTIDARPLSEILSDPDVVVSVTERPTATDALCTLKLSRKGRGSSTLSVNPAHNYLVECADRYYDYDAKLVWRTFRVHEAEHMGQGVWVPKAWRVNRFGASNGQAVDMEIPREWKMTSMSLQARPGNEEFRVEFPVGTMVSDRIKGTMYQTGVDMVSHPDGDPDKWASVQQLTTTANKANPQRVRSSYIFATVNAVVLASISIILWQRFRHVRRVKSDLE